MRIGPTLSMGPGWVQSKHDFRATSTPAALFVATANVGRV
jgi:hypothetical protein